MSPTERPRRRTRAWTILVVPDSGGGGVRQRTLTERQLRVAVGALAAVALPLVALAASAAWTLPRAREADRLQAENAALHESLGGVEERLARMDVLAMRVEAFDEQVRALVREGALPGGGPLEAEDQALFSAWLEDRERPGTLDGLPEASVERAAAVAARAEQIEDAMERVSDSLAPLQHDVSRFWERQDALPQLWPVEGGVVTSGWGWRRFPFGGRWAFHYGVDIGVDYGTPIVATADGTVVKSGGDERTGRTVVIDHGSEVYTRYGHASFLAAEEGEEVLMGQIIAYSGNSGLSTGPHLHFDLILDGESVDALDYLPARD